MVVESIGGHVKTLQMLGAKLSNSNTHINDCDIEIQMNLPQLSIENGKLKAHRLQPRGLLKTKLLYALPSASTNMDKESNQAWMPI